METEATHLPYQSACDGPRVAAGAEPGAHAAALAAGAGQGARWLGPLKRHWPEYLMEAAGLGLFMVSACGFAVLLFHPASPVSGMLNSPLQGRMLMGLAMGLTAIGIIYSPLGQRSGAHINPATTLTFLRLGKIDRRDALWYIFAQFAGSVAGVVIASLALGQLITHPSVNYAITVPGADGAGIAFIAEVAISFLLMAVVLTISNRKRVSRLTGLCVGLLVAIYISFEQPLSGMSMNPARTFGSALLAQVWTGLWVYFIAPPAGMLLAAEVYTRVLGSERILCAKLNHHTTAHCIFRCNYQGGES
jgi:aquaporin Z